MKAQPTVSVIIPTYNRAQLLSRAISSVLAQTFQDWELLVVDDASGDNTSEVVLAFDDPRIRHHVNSEPTSLVDQRNRALSLARADVVAVQDADDASEPHRLAEQLDFLGRHPEVSVFGSQLALMDGSGRPLGYRAYPTRHEEIRRVMRMGNPVAQPSVAFRRRVIAAAGGWSYRRHPVCSDYELWSRLARQGVGFANHREALVRYRLHAGALKARHVRESLRATLDIKRTCWSEELDWRARLRMLGERGLLLLPERVVLRLFLTLERRRRLPEAPG